MVLGDWGAASWTDKHLTELLQPVALRSPEVLLGAPWGPAADIWNVSAIVSRCTGRCACSEAKLPRTGATTSTSI
ncbi:CMGC protein kinase [Apiospora rasikravindrae]|uniref:CMGC protein kinase n=1 Tax=Apiospora rasikravindrae TaxID=990691 RepID=A0ABR1TW66_9PEZI